MSPLPAFASEGRKLYAAFVVGAGITQAVALAIATFATRDAFALLHTGLPLTPQVALALALSALLAATALMASRRMGETLGQSYAIDLRRVLYNQIAHLPKARHETRRLGALALRFVGDLSAARLWFGRGLPDVLAACVILPGAVFTLFMLDARLASWALLPLGGALLIMAVTAWHLEQRHRALRKHRANIAISMIERIAIAPELDLMGRTDKELRALDKQGRTLKQDAVARRGRTAGLVAILQVGIALSGLMVLWRASVLGTSPASVAASLSMLGLVALPLQNLGAAWDQFCAWRVAREKALRLLAEPTLERHAGARPEPVELCLTGMLNGAPVSVQAPAGQVSHLNHPQASALARIMAGLDRVSELTLRFNGESRLPALCYIGDTHICLQGSLRRNVCLNASRRPSDRRIKPVLTAFGLDGLLAHPEGLDQRIAANGGGLSADQTLRLDLARAVLSKAEVIVISSLRWSSNRQRSELLKTLRRQCSATIIICVTAPVPSLHTDPKAL